MEQVSQLEDRMECARRALLAALDSLSYDSPNDILISQSLQSTAMTGYYFEPQRERILALAQSYQRIMRASRGGLKGFIKELAYHRHRPRYHKYLKRPRNHFQKHDLVP